jgi:hypothetical protein
VRAGVHVAPSKSPTLKEAGESWIESANNHKLERTIIDSMELPQPSFLGVSALICCFGWIGGCEAVDDQSQANPG